MTDWGDVQNLSAYVQSKMLDHSSWRRGENPLPRGCSASDIDSPSANALDNCGAIILFELERGVERTWLNVQPAQRGTYQSLIRNTRHIAAVCSYDVPVTSERFIDTRHDVTAFQLMAVDGAMVSLTHVIVGNEHWQNFVCAWFQSLDQPEKLRRRVITNALNNGRQNRALRF